MDKQKIIKKILKVAKKCGHPHFSAQTVFSRTSMDSLDKMDFLVSVEEAFKITLPEDKLERVQSVEELTNLVEASL